MTYLAALTLAAILCLCPHLSRLSPSCALQPHQQQARRQQQQVRGAALVGRAKKEDEERALQELAKQVDSKDIWENETLSAVAQVGLVVAAVIVGGLFFTVLGRPVIDYTLDAFPKQ